MTFCYYRCWIGKTRIIYIVHNDIYKNVNCWLQCFKSSNLVLTTCMVFGTYNCWQMLITGSLVWKRSIVTVCLLSYIQMLFRFFVFVCLGNAVVEVYRRLNGVTGEVVEPFNIYSDDIGWSLRDIESCWGCSCSCKSKLWIKRCRCCGDERPSAFCWLCTSYCFLA